MRFRRSRKNDSGTYLLQLTSMVDMFTIILVFLLKSYSTSAYHVTPSDAVELPNSKSQSDPKEGTKLSISSKSIALEDEVLVKWENENGWKQKVHKKEKRLFIDLYKKLKANIDKEKELNKANSEISLKNRVVLQADKSISYDLIRTVMVTAVSAGYDEVHLLALKE